MTLDRDEDIKKSLPITISKNKLASLLIGLATMLLLFRVPGSFYIAIPLMLISICLTGINYPKKNTALLWIFYITALFFSAIAITDEKIPFLSVNFFTISGTFIIYSIAMLTSGNDRLNIKSVINVFYFASGLLMFVGIGEIIADFKIISILYPNELSYRVHGRFQVSAIFPNYNDLAVVITMFSIITLTKLVMANNATNTERRNFKIILRLILYVLSTAMILIMGSRGASIALVLGSFLIILYSMRLLRPQLFNSRRILLSMFGLSVIGLIIWRSKWIQNHSTQIRETIIANTLKMTPPSDSRFWNGWGNIDNFNYNAAKIFPWQLMNPHNIMLETLTWFGFPAFVIMIFLWAYITWRGIINIEIKTGWEYTVAITLVALTPILGVVPSTSLSYYHLFLLLPCALIALKPQVLKKSQAAVLLPSETHHHGSPSFRAT